MADPAGTGQEVPILGADRDPRSGKVIPLGGTMEDPEGEGGTEFVELLSGKELLAGNGKLDVFVMCQQLNHLLCFEGEDCDEFVKLSNEELYGEMKK